MIDEAELRSAGWKQLAADGFSAAIGPIWLKGKSGERTVALAAQQQILRDDFQIVHGGALMTFTDIALGIAAVDGFPGEHLVTVQLQYQFVRGAPAGSLITCRPELVRKTASLAFVRGLLEAGGETVGSADGIFKAARRP